MKDVFKRNGPLAKRLNGYEFRAQQKEMCKAVQEAIEQQSHLVVEAGTGVGKTLAYLIPVVAYTLATQKPVVISTNTINLQEQILHKDLPTLQSALDTKLSVALAIGRSNYLCFRRLDQVMFRGHDLFNTSIELEELRRIKEWTKKTLLGSRSSLDWLPSSAVWEKVSSDKDNCAGKKCSFFKKCFYRQARNKLWSASIILVNHPLLIIDSMLRQEKANILPDYELLIVDEAHRLANVAQEHMGIELTNGQIQYLLNSLYHPRTGKGFLSWLPQQAPSIRHCKKMINEVRAAADTFFNEVLRWLEGKAPKNGRVHKKGFIPNLLGPVLAQLYFALEDVKKELNQKKYLTPSRKKKATKTTAETNWDETELISYLKKARNLTQALDVFINQSAEDHVYWIETGKRARSKPRIVLKSAPIKVNKLISESILDQVKTSVFTSATLATSKNDGVKYIKETLGITKSIDLVLGSPFKYDRQVKIHIPRVMPNPNNKDKFFPMVSDKILKYLNQSQGRAFVLFTSYELMDKVYERISPILENKGIKLYKQGKDLSRHQILEMFKNRVGSVIFGADSFWQGVDVPGEALENIIITKLPFPVPTNPLVEAKIEEMERNGINSFSNYFIPEAVIKLKQGFGRLIRNKKDKGIVVILDNRVITRSYGHFFLEALPKCPIIIDN